jgi:DNA adenine methylase
MLAPWIISNFPAHRIYCEPFGGGASVLMRKPRSYAEIYNDIDGEVVNVFRCLQNKKDCQELERLIRLTPFAREEFEWSYTLGESPVQNARRTIIRAFMGFGSNGHNPNERTGFRANANRSGTTPAHDWLNWPDEMEKFYWRLAGVTIENRAAIEVMAQQDSPQTLHFVDPPYVHCTRGVRNGYRFEMTDEQHEELREFLKSLTGMVILCGYRNEIYDRLGWQTVEREAHADGARDRIEVLWLNPAAANAQTQQRLL